MSVQKDAADGAKPSASASATSPVHALHPHLPSKFHASSGPTDPLKVPEDVPIVGIDRARALRRIWLTQSRPLPPERPEPDFDELEEAFDDEVPFEPPVSVPNLCLLLLELWEDEGLLN